MFKYMKSNILCFNSKKNRMKDNRMSFYMNIKKGECHIKSQKENLEYINI